MNPSHPTHVPRVRVLVGLLGLAGCRMESTEAPAPTSERLALDAVPCTADAGSYLAPPGDVVVDLTLDGGMEPADFGPLVNSACAAGNGSQTEVLIPPGLHCVQTEINPTSNCWIHGKSRDSAAIMVGNRPDLGCTGLGANRVFRVAGTPEGHVSNVEISDLIIVNGIPSSDGYDGGGANGLGGDGLDGIRADYCDHCTFQGLFLDFIQGHFGIVWKNSTYVAARNNFIQNFYYQGIGELTGSQCEWIENNMVVDAVNRTGESGLAYGIGASGHEGAKADGPYAQHAWITENLVSNVPTWECYDTHGGKDQHFVHNTGLGCYFGIQAGTGDGGSSFDKLDGVEITGNYLNRIVGVGQPNGYGIVLAGGAVGTAVTGAVVTENTVIDYGSTPDAGSEHVGAIHLVHTRGAQVTSNWIPRYYQSAINAYADNWNAVIGGNVAQDLMGSNVPARACAILVDAEGNWGLSVDANASLATSQSTAPFGFLCNQSLANHVSIGFSNLAALQDGGQDGGAFLADGGYFWASDFPRDHPGYGYLPVNLTQPPVATDRNCFGGANCPFNIAPGDFGYDLAYATLGYDPAASTAFQFGAPDGGAATGYFSFDTTDTVSTGDLAAGSNTITNLGALCSNLTGDADEMDGGVHCIAPGQFWWYGLPVGMNVTVAGAGADGGLNAQILADDGKKVTLDTAATTPVTGAHITWQGGAVIGPN
jgi:hypothetical protein